MRQPLVMDFRKCIILANYVLVNVASIILAYTANAFQSSLKDAFQFFTRNHPQNRMQLFK
jgi:hypothetical protein